MVDGEAQRFAHADVVERCLLVVEGERRLVGRASRREGEVAGVLELRREVRVDGGEHIDVAGQRCVDAGGEVGDVLELDLGDPGRIPQ